MASNDDSREPKEQLYRLAMMEERNRRVVFAIVAVIISGTIMAAGIVVIGGAQEVHRTLDTAYSSWNTFQLEMGIFITLIGTVMMALSASFLAKSWKI